ncbi:MAG: tripartite tricarboxylate transporter permease [Rhodobacteraceae bacterium]|nr:tripartite tricarboxylate transporter permease [Paracoccaceae bacterium]
MELWASTFDLILDWRVLVFLPLGVVMGAIIGAIPGLTITMSISVLLPFTLFLDPLPGLVLLLGISKGGLFGGSIAAILLNVPGTPAAACTMLDGYPLARKGRGGEAVDTALWASFIGDLISVLALVLLAGALAQLGLRFGPVELFALIVFSLTVIAAISTSGLLKGIVGGGLGLLAGTIGLDMVYGSERFTFGSPNLYDGLAFMPLLVGLFALPDILLYYFGPRQGRVGTGSERRSTVMRLSRQDFRMVLPTILKGSTIGVILGAIPGIGATASTFVSYSEAKRTAPDRDEFGKGALSGVAAAESANSGTGASTLIPLLALGIPGDVVGAMLLGAFFFHGLAPGPLLFANNMDFVQALYITLLISSLIVLVVGRYGVRYIQRIVEVPRDVLFPIVLVLTVIGAFAISNSIFAVWVMLAAGLLGVVFRALRIPEAAFLIGFVLSPLLENNMQRVLIISRGDYMAFFSSWIALLFYAATLAAIIGGILLPRIRQGRVGRA